MFYDLIIIGAGPAGITAAVYAARQRLDFLVVTRDIGGQTAISGSIENYTGYQFISGPELANKFDEHIRKYNVPVKENEIVTEVEKKDDIIYVTTNRQSYTSRTLIIASGKAPRLLNIPGEEEFKNRGVTYCATCDAPLFQGKDVAVIGGGNSALDASLQLIKIAQKIYLININPKLGGEITLRQKVVESEKVTVLNNSKTTQIFGDTFVKGIKILQEGQEKNISLEGIFIEIGSLPAVDFIPQVEKNKFGEIIIDKHNKTTIEGIFAAGDVTDVPEKQIIVAAGEGSKAALSVFRYLASLKKK